MGLYVEVGHDKESKRQWFKDNGMGYDSTSAESMYNATPKGSRLVCLVDNGPFYAAAVAYCLAEAKTFGDPYDGRPKEWYIVSDENLKPNCPNWDTYIEE